MSLKLTFSYEVVASSILRGPKEFLLFLLLFPAVPILNSPMAAIPSLPLMCWWRKSRIQFLKFQKNPRNPKTSGMNLMKNFRELFEETRSNITTTSEKMLKTETEIEKKGNTYKCRSCFHSQICVLKYANGPIITDSKKRYIAILYSTDVNIQFPIYKASNVRR